MQYMKKYVQEATDENIWTSIKNNTFGRNKDIKDFIDGLELIDESACISLDAKWGDGKTFFVRQIEEVLKYVLANQRADEENPIEKLPSYEYLKDNEMMAKIDLKHSYLPIYYNAWMYDNHSDPLMSLLLVMTVDQHIIIWHFRRIKLCRNNAGIFHPRTPGILVITVIEKIITVITRLKMGYFNFPDSANYGIK